MVFVGEGAKERGASGAAGVDEGAVDVEEKDVHGPQYIRRVADLTRATCWVRVVREETRR